MKRKSAKIVQALINFLASSDPEESEMRDVINEELGEDVSTSDLNDALEELHKDAGHEGSMDLEFSDDDEDEEEESDGEEGDEEEEEEK